MEHLEEEPDLVLGFVSSVITSENIVNVERVDNLFHERCLPGVFRCLALQMIFDALAVKPGRTNETKVERSVPELLPLRLRVFGDVQWPEKTQERPVLRGYPCLEVGLLDVTCNHVLESTEMEQYLQHGR